MAIDNGMAETLWGIRLQPFAATADPAFFFPMPSCHECLFRLWETIQGRNGIAVVLGGYGAGKTTILRKLIADMEAEPGTYNPAVLESPIPAWSSFDMLSAISRLFRLNPAADTYSGHMEALHDYLRAHADQATVLIVDDAQNLTKRGQLELLRLAQNIEAPTHKLLNILLFAQLDWLEALEAAPNFRQRVDMIYTLEPMTAEETAELIQGRLARAGAHAPDQIFTGAAIRIIHAYAEGSPRLTVNLCRNVLSAATQLKEPRVDIDLVLYTLDRTAALDPVKRARLDTAARNLNGGDPETSGTASGITGRTPSERMRRSEEARANRLLLRAARGERGKLRDARQGESQEREDA